MLKNCHWLFCVLKKISLEKLLIAARIEDEDVEAGNIEAVIVAMNQRY